jgi:hypothetical protein
MRKEELDELHYITPLANVSSILSRGILSHNLASKVPHESVAMQEVQDRRVNKRVPGAGGRTLHDYANVSICARNPMLFKRRDIHTELCVLRINIAVLDLDGVIVTDRNAAATIVMDPCLKAGACINPKEEVQAGNMTRPSQGRLVG